MTDTITRTESTRVSLWRAQAIAFLRMAFGIVWAIDAWLKWQPEFIKSFSDQVTGAQKDQAPLVQSWISLWGMLWGAIRPCLAI
jgi:nitrite reductase (NO-forming)